jgi:hypothetical protein
MPKSRRKQQERENWSWNGFVVGLFIGAFVYSIGSGCLNPSPNLMVLAQILTLFGFLFGLFLTVYNIYARKAFFTPFKDGAISGFVFGATIVDIYLHGLRLF